MSSRGNDITACNYLWIIIQGDSNRLTVFTPSIVSTKVFEKKLSNCEATRVKK